MSFLRLKEQFPIASWYTWWSVSHRCRELRHVARMVGYWLRFPQVVPSTLPKETKSGSLRQLAPPVVTMASGEEMGQVHPVMGETF